MSRKVALIIGNSEYQDANLAKLVTPHEDVNDLADVLRSPDIGSFDEVVTLVNESDAAVRLSIEDFFADKKPDDLLVMYFSGHGVRDEQGRLFLAVNNTRATRLRATAIPSDFITGEMDRSRSRRQVLILDCCHSGAFAQGAKAATGESAGVGPAFEGSGYGRIVLTATDATQYAWEGDQIIGQAENSVFTHHLIEGLKTGKADADGDGRITVGEMYDYVYEQVVTAHPKQTPGKWSYKQQGDIVIAKNPHPPVVKAAELPIELRQAIESPLANVREGAVRELDRLLRSSNTGLALAAQEALKHLVEDDSRRVSLAASDSLKAHTGQVQASQQAAQQKAEAENSAQAKAEQEPVAGLNTTQQTDLERTVEPQAEAERVIAAELTPSASFVAETQKSSGAAATTPAVLLRTLIVAGGWVVGWVGGIFLTSIIDSHPFLILIPCWSIAALITGLILRRTLPSLQAYHVVILMIVWALVPLVGLIVQGTGGSGNFYETSPALIASIAFTWLINSWFVLQVPPLSMWWQALAVGAAGTIGWVIAGTDRWNLVALKFSGYGWSLPAVFHDFESVTMVGLLSNVILSGLIGGGALAIIYGLTRRFESVTPEISIRR